MALGEDPYTNHALLAGHHDHITMGTRAVGSLITPHTSGLPHHQLTGRTAASHGPAPEDAAGPSSDIDDILPASLFG